MLVFSRKKDESIMIGNHIELKVISVGKDTVKLGIDAPRKVIVHRKELFEAVAEQNQAAVIDKLSPQQLRRIQHLVQGTG